MTEVPLLYEVGGEARFDAVVVVTAPEDAAPRRARASPSTTAARGSSRTRRRCERADFAYVNDGSLEELDGS